tara:strand:+ start:4340 stop:4726 length:387 start_codon:yes stop_codon:yes gene_type:complete
MVIDNLPELLGAVGGGGLISALTTYFSVRQKVGSELEREFMKAFDANVQRHLEEIKAKDERIDKLYEKVDSAESRMRQALEDERHQCKEELIELERRLKEEWDRQITDGRNRLTSRERQFLDTMEDIK